MKKKVILSLLVVSSLFVLTACGGGKKLTCTMEEEGNKMTANIVFDKDGTKVEKATVDSTFAFEDEDTAKQMVDFLKSACEGEDAPKDCSVKQKGKEVTMTMSGDAEESEMTGTYDEVKADLIEEGYTCK